MMLATLAWLVAVLVLGAVPLVVVFRRLARPTPADGYCCICSGRACGWGCCHRSCIDHAAHDEWDDYLAQADDQVWDDDEGQADAFCAMFCGPPGGLLPGEHDRTCPEFWP